MRINIILIILSIMICFLREAQAMKIITIFDGNNQCLSQKASAFMVTKEVLKQARIIADQLIKTLSPLMPAAGLAAPQIGITKQIFIYSWDRTFENIEVIIIRRFCSKGLST